MVLVKKMTFLKLLLLGNIAQDDAFSDIPER